MNKTIKNTLKSLFTLFLISIGLPIWYAYFNEYSMLIFVVIIFAVVFSELIFSRIPTKKQTIKTTTKIQQTPQKKKTPSKKKKTDKEILTTAISDLEGDEFERLCYLYFKDKGFNPEETPRTGDHGVDLVIKDPKDGLKIAVQCKRHKYNIGNGVILKLDGGKRFYGCPKALCITTSNYTYKAKEYAEKCKVDLWNGLHVNEKIGIWRKQKLNKIS